MTDRKDKIKNITIIFLLVMLILTFFSNTIMNYSLVEVSTQQVTSGQITSKVRGSGSVEASESYSVTIEETRKIATVNVKKDAEVATGDLLFTLEDTDSDELDAAKKSLNEAQAAYESAVLTAGITVAERQSIEAGKGSSLTQKQNEIAAANQRVKDAQAAKCTLEKVQLISFAESLGGVETLLTYPTMQTHGDVPAEVKERLCITDDFLRLSVGIEDVDDLIADLAQALE